MYEHASGRFVAQHSDLFDPSCSSGCRQYSHGQHEIWQKYRRFVEHVLGVALETVASGVYCLGRRYDRSTVAHFVEYSVLSN